VVPACGSLLAVTLSGAAAPAAPVTVQGGLQTPESVLHDPAADAYLVSNINGTPTGTGGNRVLIPLFMDHRVVVHPLP